MAQFTYQLRTVLHALEFLVIGIVWVAHPGAHVATLQAELAGLIATTLRCTFEVSSARCLDLFIRMVLTAQRQSSPYLAVLCQSVKDVAPQWNRAEHAHISNTIKTHLSTRESNTDSVRYVQEADLPIKVAAHQRQYDDIVLLPLVLVNDMDFDAREFWRGHELAQTVKLSGVSCENGNPGRLVVLVQQVAAKLDHETGFVRILVAPSVLNLFLEVTMTHKKEIF